MGYKRFRYTVGACLFIGYFVIFYTPLAELLPLESGRDRHLAQEIYIFAECAIYFLIALLQNRMAKKRGEEVPYPNFPYWY